MSVFVINLPLTPAASPALTQYAKVQILAGAVAATAFLDATKLQPFINNFTPDPSAVYGDFTAPTWTGYAAQTITWNAPGQLGEFGATAIANSVDWTVGGDGDPFTLYGFWLANEDLDAVVAYARLPTPVAFTSSDIFSAVLTLDME